jgi:transcriptional regulator with XRE-family HTH domain
MVTVIGKPTFLDPREIREGLSLSQERLSTLLKVSSKTVLRWEKDNQTPRDPEVLGRLAFLKEIKDLGTLVYTKEGLKEFLSTPLPIFGGRSALVLLQLGEYEPVISALAADFEGTGF